MATDADDASSPKTDDETNCEVSPTIVEPDDVPCFLEELPVELIVMLLKWLDWGTAENLIQASPAALRTFKANCTSGVLDVMLLRNLFEFEDGWKHKPPLEDIRQFELRKQNKGGPFAQYVEDHIFLYYSMRLTLPHGHLTHPSTADSPLWSSPRVPGRIVREAIFEKRVIRDSIIYAKDELFLYYPQLETFPTDWHYWPLDETIDESNSQLIVFWLAPDVNRPETRQFKAKDGIKFFPCLHSLRPDPPFTYENAFSDECMGLYNNF